MQQTPKNFALTGVAGYIAPRHLKAVHDLGHRLIAAVDPHDSVGILDRWFPQCRFFTEYERFDRFLEKRRRKGPDERMDFLSVCAPNYLHDAHARTALRLGANVICEKPLVINPWNLDALQELEAETGSRVFTILQLRVHPDLERLRETFRSGGRRQVRLTYVTPRGHWYLNSWKGNLERSGGLVTNIGIHFFDLLVWLFGEVDRSEVYLNEDRTASGMLSLKRADVSWYLSIDPDNVRAVTGEEALRPHRSILVDGEEIEFSNVFSDLHTEVYRRTLDGRGFGIDDARTSIKIVSDIRGARLSRPGPEAHPMVVGKPQGVRS